MHDRSKYGTISTEIHLDLYSLTLFPSLAKRVSVRERARTPLAYPRKSKPCPSNPKRLQVAFLHTSVVMCACLRPHSPTPPSLSPPAHTHPMKRPRDPPVAPSAQRHTFPPGTRLESPPDLGPTAVGEITCGDEGEARDVSGAKRSTRETWRRRGRRRGCGAAVR